VNEGGVVSEGVNVGGAAEIGVWEQSFRFWGGTFAEVFYNRQLGFLGMWEVVEGGEGWGVVRGFSQSPLVGEAG
jgi:hypothetical protein